MTLRILTVSTLFASLAFSQQQAEPRKDTSPLYRVTVVERTVQAVNYQYRSGPTQIDFHGTVLLPYAKGNATVESKRGSTEIEASLHGLASPQRFGREYLVYVLWAITPEGRPHNIGELIPDGSDNAKIRVTTDLQAYALIVTAEPYSAVRQPSDVVVLENRVRPDTLGSTEPLEAKFDLLPRGEYTLHVGDANAAVPVNTPKVSMHEYEAVSELYQAQNAVNIAVSAGADQYAPDTFARARRLLAEAQQRHDRKDDFRKVVEAAREAAQTAEDARVIADRRRQQDQLQAANNELLRAKADLANARQGEQRALDQAQQAREEADAARARVAEAPRTVAPVPPPPPPPPAATQPQAARRSDQATPELRSRLLQQLRAVVPTLDSPRGLVATLPDDGFRGADPGDSARDRLGRIASILASHRGLRVSVQGYADSAAKAAQSRQRADAVRRLLIADGVAPGMVSAQGGADSRPVASNATPEGRRQNSRVEIVVSGDAIGSLPLWDHPYPLTGSAQPPSESWRR